MSASLDAASPVKVSVIDLCLARRGEPGFRSEVGRGRHLTTDAAAYRHIAYLWADRPALRPQVLAIASLCVDANKCPQMNGQSLGRVGAQLVRQGIMTRQTAATKLLVLQQQPLPQALITIKGLLMAANAQHFGTDWYSISAVIFSWQTRDLERTRRTRRQILEDFYGALPPEKK